VVTVDEVLSSPWIADPLHRLDCCVTTDGGGAFVVVSDELARSLGSDGPAILAAEEAVMHSDNGVYDLPRSISATTGPRAFAAAGITPADIDYASIYDSFTITVLVNLEGLGFFDPGAGGRLLADGALRAPFGALPVNTDGGGLCNNHPDQRGGMVRMVEAIRQLTGRAAPETQIADAEFAVVHGSGYSLGTRAAGATAILQRGDAA
jgi:acetyl-CoA C-acetyltransferase